MTTRHPLLLSPGRIGSLELRNRILMCPMGDNQATANGFVTDQQIAYFEARARGGAALLLVGSVGVTAPDGLSSPRQSALASDEMIEGWARLADRVHAHGAKLALQLVHNGKNAVMDIVAGRPMQVPSKPRSSAPDPLMGMLTEDEAQRMGTPAQVKGARVLYEVMSREGIARMVDTYAEAAERARQAGVDAIELHAGHGYLIDAFLSPTTNFRDDEYGGPVEHRARFLTEILEVTRRRVGRDFPVWCRLNGEEFFIEGQTLEEACRVAEIAEGAGADAIHVSAYADPSRAIGYSEAHATHIPGRFLEHAAAVKRRVAIPVITVGRLDPDLAERALAEGKADFVAMGRKLLADPELPNKLASGAAEDIRPCMYHYRCISQIFVSDRVACAVNAFTGREDELQLEPAAHARRLLVVGGGPAGLEAARLAALRGHRVVLAEAEDRLGGRFHYAAATSEPNAELLRWLKRQVEQQPIEVRLGTRMTANEIAAEGFDAVFVATGGRWSPPGLPGGDSGHVLCVDDLDSFLSADSGGDSDPIVVLGGDKPGLALAGVARRRGAPVAVLEEGQIFARSNGVVGRWRYVHEARELGITLEGGARVSAIEPHRVLWQDEQGRDRETPAHRVLVASGATSDSALVDALTQHGVSSIAIGDCRELGKIEGAMRDATQAAITL
jgi:2,4-dienoyl-CoA reductase-like NADH-dependent reductase (Old Yellow Enzyme family)/thioredoxin reductase